MGFLLCRNKSEHVKTFWIELKGIRDEKVMGDIVELDYQKHLDYLCTHSFEPSAVEIVFKNPNDVRTFSYQEYDQNFQSITQRYGTVERVAFRVAEPYELSRAVTLAHGPFWDAAEPMEVDTYVKRLEHDRLHDYGYTADDLMPTGPLDAEKVVMNLVFLAMPFTRTAPRNRFMGGRISSETPFQRCSFIRYDGRGTLYFYSISSRIVPASFHKGGNAGNLFWLCRLEWKMTWTAAICLIKSFTKRNVCHRKNSYAPEQGNEYNRGRFIMKKK